MELFKTVANVFLIVAIAVFAWGCGAAQPRIAMPAAPPEEAGPVSGEPKTSPADALVDEDAAAVERAMSPQVKRLYNDGVKALIAGDLDSAESLFQKALEQDDQATLPAYNLGVVHDRRGDGGRAMVYYLQAQELQPDHLPTLRAIVSLGARVGDPAQAVGLLLRVAREHPENGRILIALADAQIAAGHYEAGIVSAKRALALDERDATAILRIGVANFHLGREDLAGSIFDQVLEIDPNAARVFFYQALLELDEDRPLAAIRLFEKAIENQPTYVEAMNNLAVEYSLAGNYDEAIGWLEKAIALSPAWAALHLNYGNALRGAGRWSEAKRALDQAHKLNARMPGTYFNFGLLYYVAEELDEQSRLGRLSEAKRYFALYKSAKGAALTRDDEVHKYLKEVQLAMEREETRVQQAAERERIEAERAAQRKAGDAGESPAEDDAEEWDEDEGWE